MGETADDTGNWLGVGGPEGKTLFGRNVYRWNYNIKMDLKQDCRVWNGLSWFKIGISE
jgi:hypothetical protein